MDILALDLASKTGWCIIRDGRILESGVQDWTKKRGETNGLLFLRARRWLNDISAVAGRTPDLVAYEQAHYRGGAATEICVGLQTRAQEVAAQWGVESAPVATGTLKKWATGSGAADKSEMMAYAEVHLGRAPLDDNEADAVAVGLWAWEQFGQATNREVPT